MKPEVITVIERLKKDQDSDAFPRADKLCLDIFSKLSGHDWLEGAGFTTTELAEALRRPVPSVQQALILLSAMLYVYGSPLRIVRTWVKATGNGKAAFFYRLS